MKSKSIILLKMCILFSITGINANIRCLQCTSETDENCAEGSDVSPSECPSDLDSCYTRLVGGHVVRGCIENLLDCIVDESCKFCVQDDCNSAFWPKCFQCKAGDVGCADEQVNAPEFCAQSFGHFCYARLVNGEVTRGCGFEDPYCKAEPQNCQVCYSDGCNGLAQAALKPSKCQQCYASTRDCVEGNSSALTIDCPVLADSCFTAVTSIAASGRVIRGCSEQIGSQIRTCASNPLCVACQGDNCNNKRRLRCHQCKVTSLDSSCEEVQVFGAMYCANYREDDRCYTRVFNGFFERGFLSDLEPNVNVCEESGVESCHLCEDFGCNSQKSSSTAVAANNSTILLLLFLIVFLRIQPKFVI